MSVAKTIEQTKRLPIFEIEFKFLDDSFLEAGCIFFLLIILNCIFFITYITISKIYLCVFSLYLQS